VLRLDQNKDKESQNKEKSSGGAAGVSLGLLLGVAIGVARDNIGFWLPVGVAMGMGLGGLFSHKKEDSDNGGGNDK
jgi:hypothetical protein